MFELKNTKSKCESKFLSPCDTWSHSRPRKVRWYSNESATKLTLLQLKTKIRSLVYELEILKVTLLEVINLWDNKLTGSISASIQECCYLKALELGNNDLSVSVQIALKWQQIDPDPTN